MTPKQAKELAADLLADMIKIGEDTPADVPDGTLTDIITTFLGDALFNAFQEGFMVGR
jgi:hypothetical protein